MAIKVHGIAISTCTARIMLACPFGQMPALEDGDVKIFESRAITKYLARKYKDTGIDLLGSSSLIESTIVDTWMEVESHQYNTPMQAIIHQLIVNPMFGTASDEKIIETETEKLENVLDVYEERLSKSKYLAGDFYSMADLHHIPYLVYFMRFARSSIITSRRHVSAWWKDISSRPATVKVVESMTL
ncbi:hypothetical protein REPUB_Repub20aG0124700 [Reevesia pubescens]